MKLYPAMLNIDGRRVMVIGGGRVALRKIQDLVECGAIVKVISPEILDSILELKKSYPDKIDLIKRPYAYGDLEGALMVFSAANDKNVNHEVFAEAVEKNIFINAVDDPINCSFFVPSTFSRGDLIIAVSTSGVSPSLAAKIRKEIEKSIPETITDSLDALKKIRFMLMDDDEFQELSSEKRGELLKRITGNDKLMNELTCCGNDDALKEFLSKNK